MSPNRRLSTVAAGVLAAVLAAIFWQLITIKTYWPSQPPPSPAAPAPPLTRPPVAAATASDTPAPPTPTPSSPHSVVTNLAVPFTPQAPSANWAQPYQDACEEAAVLMVEHFWQNTPFSPHSANQEILQLVDFQVKQFGFYKDSNTAETARWVESYYPHLAAAIKYDVTADEITAALKNGIPVIVLVNGRRLGNPFYTPPGPDKHALVIKGIAGDSFITNDPGTRRGADYHYPQTKVLQAMIDYDGAKPGTHTKAMLLLSPRPGQPSDL
ncbi:MAG: C39 family peptidase [Candidatus Andersenbacteria bacterium]|nr:C39 family peptidase [Candidatus Andersenbacteria bacterium]